MANVLVDETSLQNIADSIRAKNGSSDTYTPAQMSTAIDNIPSGGGSSGATIKTYFLSNPITLNAASTYYTIISSSINNLGNDFTWNTFKEEMGKTKLVIARLSETSANTASSYVSSTVHFIVLCPYKFDGNTTEANFLGSTFPSDPSSANVTIVNGIWVQSNSKVNFMYGSSGLRLMTNNATAKYCYAIDLIQ